jgi:hypothetical protein
MHCHGRVSLSLIFSPIANHAAASLTPPWRDPGPKPPSSNVMLTSATFPCPRSKPMLPPCERSPDQAPPAGRMEHLPTTSIWSLIWSLVLHDQSIMLAVSSTPHGGVLPFSKMASWVFLNLKFAPRNFPCRVYFFLLCSHIDC